MSQIQFKGKQFTQNHHLAVKYHELVPKKDKSLTDKVRLDDNLIIRGDNLKALKALLPTYAGKVKCIYIDPPYNTGNEKWAYNDNVNSPMMQEWLGKVVDREDLTRHDKWLCMMAPRLKLLRELLRDDGVIFISIDDNEQHRLRMLMDEIFGEERFITNFIWKKKGTSTNVAGASVSELTDYILAYGKTDLVKLSSRIRLKETREYSLKDDEGNYRLTIIEKKNTGEYERESMRFPIMGIAPREGKRWQIGEEKAHELEKKNRFIVEDGVVKLKIYDFEDHDTFSAQPNLLGDHGTTDTAAKMLTEIFGKQEIFNNPKPIALVEHLISISSDKDSIILDSFAGSGTTAHAVLALNKEDGGNRKFILVEMEDYADGITAERVRRVIKGYGKNGLPSSAKATAGTGGTFSYFELGKPIEMENILSAKDFPIYKDLARYVFYTATGEEFDEKAIDEKRNFIGESKEYEVYLFYKPEIAYLKNTALTLDRARALGKPKGKTRLIFAPTKYLDQDKLDEHRIIFAQLPFEIYKLAE